MRARLLLGGGLALVVGVTAVGLGSGRLGSFAPASASGVSPSPAPVSDLATAAVARRTLATAANLDGTLAYEGAGNVGAGVAGTVTWLPAEGTVIKRGGVLYELDGTVRPRLLFGSRPLWRPLGPGVTNGADVRQLEQNLKAMGYASRKLRVDYHWDKYTTAAVKRWQKAVHWKADGTLDAGDIAFLPGPVRVASHQATLGAGVGPGAPVVGISTARRVVTLDLAATRQDLVKAGQTVSVTLPGGSTISGKVRRIGRVATPGQNGNPATVPVTIDLGDGTTLPDLDAAPVTVHVTTVEHANVLAVPVNSLVALLEGGYAVETVRPDGSHKYIGVTPGLYQDGYVEVSGSGLAAGDTVVVAR